MSKKIYFESIYVNWYYTKDFPEGTPMKYLFLHIRQTEFIGLSCGKITKKKLYSELIKRVKIKSPIKIYSYSAYTFAWSDQDRIHSSKVFSKKSRGDALFEDFG